MKRIPGSREVDRALKNLVREVKSTVKQVNQQAGKLLAQGNYTGAEELVAVGKSVTEFQADVESVRRKWRTLGGRSDSDGGSRTEKTPLWRYYAPTLQALIRLGGSATRKEIEGDLELVSNQSPDSDLKPMRSWPRWKTTLQRALQAMTKEGFVERRRGKQWSITPAGRKATDAKELQERRG